MKAKEILNSKSGAIITIKPQASILDAVKVLCENKIGSLIVQNNEGESIGIITERDVLQEIYSQQGNIIDSTVDQVMTKNMLVAEPDDTVDYMMSVMTQNRIRHLPVMNGDKTVGMISVGDLVKAQLANTEDENVHLKNFIQQSG